MIKELFYMITHRCPLSCPLCCAKEGPEINHSEIHPIYLIEDFKRLVNQGLEIVSFTGGEPFSAFGKMLRAIDIFKDLGISNFRIFTSGYLCTPENIKQAVDAGVKRFHVSIDGLEFEHDAIRGQGSWIKAIDAIKEMRERGAYVKVVSVLSKETLCQIDSLTALLSPMVDEIQFREPNLVTFAGKEFEKDFNIINYTFENPKVSFLASGNFKAVCDKVSMKPNGDFTRCGHTKEIKPLDDFLKGAPDACKLYNINTNLNCSGYEVKECLSQ